MHHLQPSLRGGWEERTARLTPTALVSICSEDCNHQRPAAGLHLQAHAPRTPCTALAQHPPRTRQMSRGRPAQQQGPLEWAGGAGAAAPGRRTPGWRRGDGPGGCAQPALKQLSVFRWHLLAFISTGFPPPGTTSPNRTQIFNKMTAGRVPGREGMHGCCTKALCLQTAPLDTLK